jgi:hypothetical protein
MMRDEADYQPARQASATRQMAWNLTHPEHASPLALNASPRASAIAADSTQVERLKREIAKWAGLNGEATPDLSNVTDIQALTRAAKSGRLKFKATTGGAAPLNSESLH